MFELLMKETKENKNSQLSTQKKKKKNSKNKKLKKNSQSNLLQKKNKETTNASEKSLQNQEKDKIKKDEEKPEVNHKEPETNPKEWVHIPKAKKINKKKTPTTKNKSTEPLADPISPTEVSPTKKQTPNVQPLPQAVETRSLNEQVAIKNTNNSTETVSLINNLCNLSRNGTVDRVPTPLGVNNKPESLGNIDLFQLENRIRNTIQSTQTKSLKDKVRLIQMLQMLYVDASVQLDSPGYQSKKMCEHFCSVPFCNNYCSLNPDEKPHLQHLCSNQQCEQSCHVPGCDSLCNDRHFHNLFDPIQRNSHDCGGHDGEALCGKGCEFDSCNEICEIAVTQPHSAHTCAKEDVDCSFYCSTPGCVQYCEQKTHAHAITKHHHCSSHSNCFTLPHLFSGSFATIKCVNY